ERRRVAEGNIAATATMKPRRIQRKRTKGWEMPEGAVYVGRPSIWGNPHKADSRAGRTRNHAVKLFGDYAHHQLAKNPRWVAELRGKDLACWCPLDQPC